MLIISLRKKEKIYYLNIKDSEPDPDLLATKEKTEPKSASEILRDIRRKKRLWAKAKSGEGVEEYKKVEKEVRNKIRSAKRKFEKRLANCGEKDE